MKGRISHHEGTKSTKAGGRTGKAFATRETAASRLVGLGLGRTGKLFWRQKMASNLARDRFVTRALRKQGWKVVRVWEHELARGRSQETEDRRRKVVERIKRAVERAT
jgi:G:T-mismatch repair DNA endonuclease (very short patch repair protein)